MKEIKIKILYKDGSGKELEMFDLFPGLSGSEYKFTYSDNPDFILYRQTGSSKYFDYKCVRISLEPERYLPDFNICDYAISDAPIEFGDRHFRMPYLAYPSMRKDWLNTKKECEKVFTKKDLKNKDIFCNYIYSNGKAEEMRKSLFDLLSQYKFVHSGGLLFNNIGYQIGCGINKYDEKVNFQTRSKFTLAVENVSAPGYTTEKILHAFMARTIPIYWGDPMVSEIFNREAFIDCNNSNTFEEILEKIKDIDNDDEKYVKMINRPVFNEGFSPQQYEKNLIKFLENIFEQDPQNAFRRTRVLHSLYHEGYVRNGKKRFEKKAYIKIKIMKILIKFGINKTQPYQKWKKYIHEM